MAAITASMVAELRAKTDAPMMECKKALTEADGDMAKAEAWLREKLKGKMDTRTDRAAGQGCISVCIESGRASICELRAETDFTAKNDEFRAMASAVSKMACEQSGEVKATAPITARMQLRHGDACETLAALVASHLPQDVLRWLFAAFLIVIAVRIWVGADRDARTGARKTP